tara:strand:- start:1176 stop:1370 length:195 start_codon:yes stop_codon:yes gene_type:complete
MTLKNSYSTTLIASYEAKGYTFDVAFPISTTETIYRFTSKSGKSKEMKLTHASPHARLQFKEKA